jgi:hypothetical protein
MQIVYLTGALFSLYLVITTFQIIPFDVIMILVFNSIVNKKINTPITYLDLLIILQLFNIILFLICSSFYIDLIIFSSIRYKLSVYKITNI